jgi:hypothetical protein
MIQTIRVLWRGLRWNQPLTLNWGAVTANSVVHISVSEAKRIYGMDFGIPFIQRFMGDAKIEVRNISPRAGAVDFFIYIDWEDPLDITVDITLLDLPVQVIDVDENQSWNPANPAGPTLGTRSQKFIMKNLSETQAKQLQELILKDSLIHSQITALAGKVYPPSQKKLPKRKKS